MYDLEGNPAPWWAYGLAVYAGVFWGGGIGAALAWFMKIWM